MNTQQSLPRAEHGSNSFLDWLLAAGGALMLVGSLLPWTYAKIFFTVVTRDGMQLGENNTFSFDGLVTLIFGFGAASVGVLRARNRPIHRWLDHSDIAAGLVGLVVGLHNLVNAISYLTSVKSGLLFVTAYVGYGLVIVIIGSALVAMSGLVRLWNTANSDDLPRPFGKL